MKRRKGYERYGGVWNKGDFPANYDSSMCRYCEYIVICRRKEGHFEEAGEENGEGYGDDS